MLVGWCLQHMENMKTEGWSTCRLLLRAHSSDSPRKRTAWHPAQMQRSSEETKHSCNWTMDKKTVSHNIKLHLLV